MTGRRVVVTGMGIETCLGSELPVFWDALKAGKSGIRSITKFEPRDLPCAVAGEVDFHPELYLSTSEIRRTSTFQQLGLTSALRAGADRIAAPRDRIGVILGSGGAGLQLVASLAAPLKGEGWRAMDRFAMLRVLPNMAGSAIAQKVGATGPVLTIVTACAGSTDAIGLGYRLIRAGEIDAAVVVGVEVGVNEICFAGFSRLGALASGWKVPAMASRPFDSLRNGMVPSEGAAAIVLEADKGHRLLEEPRVEIVGAASTCDAFNLVAPRYDGEVAAEAITLALKDARLSASDVDYVNAHGTSTKLNDIAETKALKLSLGPRAWQIPVSSVKSMLGHSLGACGAIESVAAVLSVCHQYVTPTINLDQPDPECDLDYVAAGGRAHAIETALKVSFGFGGQNSALLFRRYYERETRT